MNQKAARFDHVWMCGKRKGDDELGVEVVLRRAGDAIHRVKPAKFGHVIDFFFSRRLLLWNSTFATDI